MLKTLSRHERGVIIKCVFNTFFNEDFFKKISQAPRSNVPYSCSGHVDCVTAGQRLKVESGDWSVMGDGCGHCTIRSPDI